MPLPASGEAVGAVYDAVAKEYDGMMVAEVGTPVYQRFLEQFAQGIRSCRAAHSKGVGGGDSATSGNTVPSIVLDTSCGSGNMLEELARKLKLGAPTTSDADKESDPSTGTSVPFSQQSAEPAVRLVGIDVSTEMVRIAQQRLSPFGGSAQVGSMLSLDGIEDGSCAGLISYFGAHHVDAQDLDRMIKESARVLAPGAPLLLGYWPGDGRPFFESGLQLDIVYHEEEAVNRILEESGFVRQAQEKPRDPNTGEEGMHLLLTKER